MFGDPELHEAVRIFPREGDEAVRILQIGRTRSNWMSFGGKFDQSIGKHGKARGRVCSGRGIASYRR